MLFLKVVVVVISVKRTGKSTHGRLPTWVPYCGKVFLTLFLYLFHKKPSLPFTVSPVPLYLGFAKETGCTISVKLLIGQKHPENGWYRSSSFEHCLCLQLLCMPPTNTKPKNSLQKNLIFSFGNIMLSAVVYWTVCRIITERKFQYVEYSFIFQASLVLKVYFFLYLSSTS